jgi:hypothetical protein
VNNIKKRNSPFKVRNNSKNNYSKHTSGRYHIYNAHKNEVKKNNYVDNNIKSSYKKGTDYEVKKQNNDYKSIGDRLSKIQSLIHQANAK